VADVKVPAVGRVPRKPLVLGGAVAAGVVGYAWWKRGTAGAVAGDPGVEQMPVEGTDDGSVWPWRPGGSTVEQNPIDPATLPPATNDEWARRAVDYLEGIGYDRVQTAEVIGKYLAHQQVSTGEALRVQVAIAFQGKPPQGDFGIVLLPTPPGGGGTTTPPPAAGKPPYYKPGVHIVGVLGTRVNPRDMAKRALPSNNQGANAVEAKLRAILAHPQNGTLRKYWGPSTGNWATKGIPGGTRIYFP
jgi:hypothetical protein